MTLCQISIYNIDDTCPENQSIDNVHVHDAFDHFVRLLQSIQQAGVEPLHASHTFGSISITISAITDKWDRIVGGGRRPSFEA